MTQMKELLTTLPRPGCLEHILVRPARRAEPVRVARVRALPGGGLREGLRDEGQLVWDGAPRH